MMETSARGGPGRDGTMGVRLQRTESEPMTMGDATVTTTALSLTVRLPFAGFVWTTPLGVTIEREGRIQRVRTVDVTRAAQMALAAAVLCAFVVSLVMTQRNTRRAR